MISEYIKNRLILVLTKRDIMPKSVNDDKIKDYLLTFQYYGNCHDARCFCGKGIFEGELLDFV